MWGGSDPAEPEIGLVDLDRNDRALDRNDRALDRNDRALDRNDRALDVAFALLAAGVLLGLPALVWVLGLY